MQNFPYYYKTWHIINSMNLKAVEGFHKLEFELIN